MELIKALPSQSFPIGATNSAAFSVDGALGANVWVETTNINGGSLVVKLQTRSPAGTWVDFPSAATASISTNTATLFKVYPGITASANSAINSVLGGGVFRVVATATTAAVTGAVWVETIL